MSPDTARPITMMALVLGTLLLWNTDVAWSQASAMAFFAQACPPAAPEAPTPPPPAVAPAPLFTPETVGPDTPPLLLRLLQEPTVEHAHAFVAWQQARQERISEVQGMLRALSRPERRP